MPLGNGSSFLSKNGSESIFFFFFTVLPPRELAWLLPAKGVVDTPLRTYSLVSLHTESSIVSKYEEAGPIARGTTPLLHAKCG
jgi:hypothetical protein